MYMLPPTSKSAPLGILLLRLLLLLLLLVIVLAPLSEHRERREHDAVDKTMSRLQPRVTVSRHNLERLGRNPLFTFVQTLTATRNYNLYQGCISWLPYL